MPPPDDDFQRDHDPRTRRNATVVGVVLVACLAALLAGVWVARNQPTSTVPTTSPAARTTPSAGATPTPPPHLRPTPVPALPVLGASFSAAYDAATQQLVVFGGIDSYDATWIWDGHRWTLARPSAAPQGRFNAASAYDPLTRVVMLYGGRLSPGDLVQDTWAWDGTTWRRLDAGSSALPPYATMAWDDSRRQMVLVDKASNSGTWTWSGTRWLRQPHGDLAAGTSLIGMAEDPVSHLLLGVSCCATGGGATSTLTWDGSAWHQVGTNTVPGFTVALVRDPISNRLLMFGDPALVPQVWSWTGRDWALRRNVELPQFPSGAVADTRTGEVVIVGSAAEPVQGSPQPVHVWTLTATGWSQLG